MSILSLLFASLLLLFATIWTPPRYCYASEAKLLHDANLVISGTFHPNLPLPWLDGWHFTGTFKVDEVLAGTNPDRELPFHIVTAHAQTDIRDAWFIFRIGRQAKGTKGTFYLERADDGTWKDLRTFCVIE